VTRAQAYVTEGYRHAIGLQRRDNFRLLLCYAFYDLDRPVEVVLAEPLEPLKLGDRDRAGRQP
jgi:hypothetical protein